MKRPINKKKVEISLRETEIRFKTEKKRPDGFVNCSFKVHVFFVTELGGLELEVREGMDSRTVDLLVFDRSMNRTHFRTVRRLRRDDP